MRIRIPIHPAFLEADDQVSLSDSYEKATKKVTKKVLEIISFRDILQVIILSEGMW